MAAKKCLKLYRAALKASCVSHTRLERTAMVKQHRKTDVLIVEMPRQTGKATIRRAFDEFIEYYGAPITAPSGRKKIVRKQLRAPSHNVNKNGRVYYQHITRSGE